MKWAAHLPYAAATALLKEVLPLQDAISTSSAKSRMRTAGRELDARIEREILAMPKADTTKKAIEATQVAAVSVDSAWLKHCVRTRFRGRQVNIVAGRATRADGTAKVVAYAGKRVVSAAARLDHFLRQESRGGIQPMFDLSKIRKPQYSCESHHGGFGSGPYRLGAAVESRAHSTLHAS